MFKRPDREVSARGQAALHLAVAALLGAGEPYDGFHGLVFAEEFGPLAFLMRARSKEGIRDFGACMAPTTAFHVLQGFGDAARRCVLDNRSSNRKIENLSFDFPV